MGRMHSSGKGISASAKPYKRTPPSWLKISPQDVQDSICKFAKKGLTPSQIGVILRDSHGIAQVNSVTGSKILRILKAHGLAPEIPEDLYHLIKKAVAIRKHLERNRKDKDSKFRLILVESRIHRLARYYKKTKKLPPVWKLYTACSVEDLLMIAVYAPHDFKDKQLLWDYLTREIGANMFNSFITNAGLVEVSLGGSSFTWSHKSATKMSKLDRFLVSESLLSTWPNITAVTLERYLSDHRPILLRESHFDYGPTPF
ncbi:40S ribosomal protein S13 [Tanacetum coccineum]